MPVDPAHAPEPTHHVPADNEPGHHPPVEQDKPSPARLRRAKARPTHEPRTFDLPFDPLYRWMGLPFDVRPETTQVEVTDDEVVIRFGHWSTRIDRSTITEAEVTGPYAFAKTAGPPHLSLADRGLTFATNGQRGVCLRLSRPVKGIDPLGVIKHPGVTVTVDDPQGLVDLLQG
jgi:hypothetical protein